MSERMARYRVPGVSVAVINNGTIDWAEGYGVTQTDGALPVTEATRFQAASIVKIVTATGALRLVQDGVLDLAKLGIALTDAANVGSDPILNQKIATQMLTKDADETGRGPGVHGEGEALHFDHAGWNHGFRSYMVVYPHLGKGVVVMANGDGGDLLINEIVRSVARAYGRPGQAPQQRVAIAVDTAALNAHAGEYDVRNYGLVLSVRRERDHLIVSTPRGSWYTFYSASDNQYFAIEDGSELAFTKAAENKPPTLRVWGMTALRRVKQ